MLWGCKESDTTEQLNNNNSGTELLGGLDEGWVPRWPLELLRGSQAPRRAVCGEGTTRRGTATPVHRPQRPEQQLPQKCAQMHQSRTQGAGGGRGLGLKRHRRAGKAPLRGGFRGSGC